MPDFSPAPIRERHGDTIRAFLHAAAMGSRADEASLWILDDAPTHLVLTVNSGTRASTLELSVRQPLEAGLVSEVFRSGKTLFDEGPFGSPSRSPAVDIAHEQSTHYMAATPFRVAGETRGVVSIVQVALSSGHRPSSEWGFSGKASEALEAATLAIASVVGSAEERRSKPMS